MGIPTLAGNATKESQVSSELARLVGSIKNLQDCSGVLGSRLVTVRQAKPTASSEAVAPPECPLCPLAEAIRSARKDIEGLTGDIVNVTAEIEL
jgi:hypothetical protein